MIRKILALWTAFAISGFFPLGVVIADDVSNDLDASVDASLENMNLSVGGGTGSVQFRIIPQDGDGRNNCNLNGNRQLVVAVNNSNAAVGTVNVSSLTFTTCPGTQTITLTPVSGGVTTISLSQTSNNSGGTFNFAPASFTVTVSGDSVPPVLSLPANITAEATGPSGKVVTFSATATDANPANPTVTCLPSSGSTFPLGTTPVDCSATDAAGNTANGSFTVTIEDTTPPVISGTPSNITMEATDGSGATVTYTSPTANDLVDGTVATLCVPASGSTFSLGDTLTTCTATDAHSNSSSSDFHVVIEDTTAPLLVLPGDLTAEAAGPSGAAVAFSPSATDLVDGPISVLCDYNSGDTFPLGTTTVNCSATDAAENSSAGSFTVTVEDTVGPEIAPHDNITTEATGPDGAVVTYDSPTATDLVDGEVTVDCSPVSGTTFPLGPTTVNCSATDTAGNTSESSFTVTVQDTTPPELESTLDMVIDATGPDGAVVNYDLPLATDLVDTEVGVECLPAPGSTFPLGHTIVNCIAADDSGNFATSFFNVFVTDLSAPAVDCAEPDGLWHATDVSLACTAVDVGSGLADPADANLLLSTNVPAGTEDANAATGTKEVCDNAGNCVTAGPVSGNMVDKLAPGIAITTPAAISYTFHQNIPADYACTDLGSGVAICAGPVADGGNIDTSSLGGKNFTVNSTDNVGNASNASVSYTVVGYTFGGFGSPLTISKKDFNKMSTVPVKFKLFTTTGGPVSNAIATLTVNGVAAVSSGGSNTGNFFRYDSSGQQYIFNLSTKGLALGTNTLRVTLDDGSVYTWTITIK